MIDPDFTIVGGGTLYMLTPATDEARAWLDEHIDVGPDTITWCGALPVEHRYIEGIVRGILSDGLTVEEAS